jgi:hypothetical protein
VLQELIYVDPSTNNTSIDDVNGHGTGCRKLRRVSRSINLPAASRRVRTWSRHASSTTTLPTTTVRRRQQHGHFVRSAGQVNAALISAGVKIMNNSWGGI